MKSGNLSFLAPSGPLQACNRTALSLQSAAVGRIKVSKEMTRDGTGKITLKG